MFIRLVDGSLETMLRTQLPLPAEAGDISFEVPSSSWSKALRRPTVNLFLFDISRSGQPNRAAMHRVDANGKGQRRAPQPMIELNYLVSAWVPGDTLGGHQLLGEVISRVAGLDQIPDRFVPEQLDGSIVLSFVEDDRHRAREIWNGAGNALQAGFSMHCTVPADTFGWAPEPTRITSIEGTTPRDATAAPATE